MTESVKKFVFTFLSIEIMNYKNTWWETKEKERRKNVWL